MTKVLSGRVALVTGGSRGIGAASARALAAVGADVAISYAASGDRAQSIVSDMERMMVRARAFKADQADPARVAAMVTDVHREFGRLDILIANAGVFEAAAIGADDTVALDRMHAVNVTGIIAAIRAASRFITDGGRIIAMSSTVATRVGAAGLADYSSTKAAIAGYIKGAARDLGPKGITVNALAIGPVETEMNPDSGPFADWLKSGTALGPLCAAGGDRRSGRLSCLSCGELHHRFAIGRRWWDRCLTGAATRDRSGIGAYIGMV